MLLIPKILLYSSYFSVLIPLFCLIGVKIQSAQKILKALGILLFIVLLSDLACYILAKMDISNILVGNIYIIAQFYVLSYIYYIFLKNANLFYTTLIIFTGFVLINTVFIQPFTQFQSWPRALASILLVVHAVVYLLQLHKNPHKDEQMASFMLWINMAVLFYFGMNLYLFITIDYVFKNESDEMAMLSWSFHNLCNIIKNILFAVAISYAGVRGIKVSGIPQRDF